MSQTPATRQPIPVGKYFLDRRKITTHQLDLALKHRAEFGLKLGQSLVELGFVTEADMVEALRHQARFPCIHLTPGIVDPGVALELGEENSRRFRAVAMNRIAKHTTVAMQDPTDVQVIEELATLLASRIFPVYAEASAIADVSARIFAHGAKPFARGPAPAASPSPETAPGSERPRSRAAKPAPAASTDREEREPAAAVAQDAPDEKAVVERVRGMLQAAFAQGVSDIHLEVRREELVARFRLEGTLFEHAILPGSWAEPLIACLKGLAKLDGSGAQEGVIPFLFKKESRDVRVATTPSMYGESAVLRILGGRRGQRTLAELDLCEEARARLEQMLGARHGLVLVVGPAGSGKSTTLHAALERFIAPNRKVVTLEHPLGRALDGVLQIPVDPSAGFGPAAALSSALRQDPDVILLGEIGDGETARGALRAALSGHLVLSSLRTADVPATVARLVHFGVEPYLLADALRGIVAQRLLRGVCSECKTPTVPDDLLLERLGVTHDGSTYFEGEGCAQCHGTGYHGRSGLHEVVPITPRLRRLIEKNADAEAFQRAIREEQLLTLREEGLRQARAGATTLHEVLAVTSQSEEHEVRTIYFAHDQQENPEARKHFLELSGYVVQLFNSHQELTQALKERQPDLVLVDVLLEGKNGFETAQEIHEHQPERAFPIVLCSQIYRLRPFREEALRCGAQDYLLLPMPPDEFLRRVNQAIAYFVRPGSEQSSALA